MAVNQRTVLDNEDLNDTDREIIQLLSQGRVTPTYVADELNISREYASGRLTRLKEHGHVDKIATGLYELVDDPRQQ
jgi:Mn-dependent DtxR family transcriptional regulator